MVQQIQFPGLGWEFTINRVAFQVFGLPIYWYGILIATGLVLAIVYGLREAKRAKIDQDDVMNMILLSVPAAIICARLYYVVFSWDQYAGDWMSVFDIRGGGLAIYGGIIGVMIVLVTYCRIKKLSLGKVLDVLAIGLLIGQAIGRWGNFINGEAFGTHTMLPWAMSIQQGFQVIATEVHPTFLYESLWNGIGIFVLLFYRRFRKFEGEEFCAYLFWYGLGRSWIEGLRADSLYIGEFRVSQLLAIATALLGIGIILYQKFWKKSVEEKESQEELEAPTQEGPESTE